eukprot:m.125671 g.125671  ORF g.125671 m.125671 type:complete len:178 (-) comp22145_c0_seq1:1654-2187(-)
MGKKMFEKDTYEMVQQFTKETKASPSTGLFAFEGGATALLPVYVFLFILHVDLESNIIVMGVFSCLAAFLLTKSYEQVATKYKGQFEKTVQAAAKTIVNEQTKNKDVSKDKKSELIRKQTSNAADEQASALSIFYNNAVFLMAFVFLAFFMFKNLHLQANYAMSVTIAAAIPFLMSS